jgi:hypothetical protein
MIFCMKVLLADLLVLSKLCPFWGVTLDGASEAHPMTNARGGRVHVHRGAAAAVVVFDITNAESFAKAKNWVKELQRQGNPNMIMALAGNKADLAAQRAVTVEEAKVSVTLVAASAQCSFASILAPLSSLGQRALRGSRLVSLQACTDMTLGLSVTMVGDLNLTTFDDWRIALM